MFLVLGLFVLPLAAAPAQPPGVEWFNDPTGKHLIVATQPAPQPAPAPAKGFPRGAKRTTNAKMMAVPQFRPAFAAPDKFAAVPPKTSYWGNNQYGDCVSAQTAASLAAWSTRCLGADKEVCATDAEVIAFARKHGWLNGATLTEVMDVMQKTGMSVGGATYREGSYYSVDYTKTADLSAALYVGPVNIAIDANALPSGAGNKSGWYGLGKGDYPNTDHCVPLFGYGSAAFCYQAMGQPLPAAVPADRFGYILYTWNTVGFVDQDWIDGTCAEAYVRNPTTVGMLPPAPPVPPIPPIPPIPPVPPQPPVPGVGFSGTLTYQNGVLVAVTPGVPQLDAVHQAAHDRMLAALKATYGAAPNWQAIMMDVLMLWMSIQSKNIQMIETSIFQLMKDLGLNIPIPPVPPFPPVPPPAPPPARMPCPEAIPSTTGASRRTGGTFSSSWDFWLSA
jgi:hypothetical protein